MDITEITNLPAQLRAITDPIERARAATDLLNAMAAVGAEVKAIRAADVTELRKTMKLQEIGTALGVSHARVSQILKGS
jgi:hypothetical protein